MVGFTGGIGAAGNAHLGILLRDLFSIPMFPYAAEDKWEDEEKDECRADDGAYDSTSDAAMGQ